MIARLLGDRRAEAVARRIDRPEAIVLAALQALIAAIGWLVPPFWLAVAVAAQLAVGGIGAIRLIGPIQVGLGFTRYAIPAMAGLAATLFGRLLPGDAAPLLVPIAAALLWSVIVLELRVAGRTGSRAMLEVALTVTLFGGAAGIAGLFGLLGWPPPLTLVVAFAIVLTMRAAEARGAGGPEAFGQALLHALAVAQVGVAAALLDLPGLVGPAIMALAFYAWGGAVDALQHGAPGRRVAVEFGALAVLGLLVALLLQR